MGRRLQAAHQPGGGVRTARPRHWGTGQEGPEGPCPQDTQWTTLMPGAAAGQWCLPPPCATQDSGVWALGATHGTGNEEVRAR